MLRVLTMQYRTALTAVYEMDSDSDSWFSTMEPIANMHMRTADRYSQIKNVLP